MFRKVSIISFTICILFLQNFAQTKNDNSFLVDGKKSSVYITFDHRAELSPMEEGESKNRIFLRLHNNTKMNVLTCGFSVDKKYGEAGLTYDVKRTRNSSVKDIPLGYGNIDTCDNFIIPSGKSILFSLPSEHLIEGLYISVDYFYSWKNDLHKDQFEGTFHYVNFSL